MASKPCPSRLSRNLPKSRFFYESKRQEQLLMDNSCRSCNMPINVCSKDNLVFPPNIPPLRLRILSEGCEKNPENEHQESEEENSQKESKETQEKWEGKETGKVEVCPEDSLVFPPNLPSLREKILSEECVKDLENDPKSPSKGSEEENPQKESKAGQEKWEGKVTQKIKGISGEKVWRTLLEDFCSFHKWLPTIDTCHHVQGLNEQPGLMRYCASTIATALLQVDNKESKMTIIKWCHEKLISIDPVEHCMRYQILDNNLGFNYYVSTIKVLESEKGCEIEWSFVADPVEGLTYEVFLGYLSFGLKGMAQNMEKALSVKTSEI